MHRSHRSRALVACLAVMFMLSQLWGASAADWPMLGRDATRNPVVPQGDPPTEWDIETGKNIEWTADLGSQTWPDPVVADGRVYIGTNNGAGYLKRYPWNEEIRVDLGCLLCFDEETGDFLWQYSAAKLASGRTHDWPNQGIGSSPLVEGERLWFVNNRWEVICADTQGFRDGENDGPFTEEPKRSPREADVVWKLDMIGKLGVSPHTAGMGPDRRCSISASYKDRIFVVTGNGVDASHVNLPAPKAPSLVCLDKTTGKVLWSDNSPGENILHGQWANPLVAEIAGRPQVIVPQGDGWIRSFDPISGELIWKFDINFKESKWFIGGLGTRNNILTTPVLYEDRIYVAGGHTAEHHGGRGRLVCLDPTKEGDISAELAVDEDGKPIPHRRIQAVDPEKGEKAVPNPNSGVIWEFTKVGDEFLEEMHRMIASVAVHDGLAIAADFPGLIHCFDAETGKRHWTYDAFASILATPLIVDDKVYVADLDGDVAIFRLSADPDVAMKKTEDGHEPVAEINMKRKRRTSIPSSPIFANGTLYIAARSKLYAIAEESKKAGTKEDDEEQVGGHWPQWRGPNRDNVSTDTDLLNEWPDSGPPLLWRGQGLGNGISPPSIGGGRLFALSRYDGTEYVRALDARSGEHLWSTVLGDTPRLHPLMRWLTQRPPTVDGDRLYSVSLFGQLVCLRAKDGKELWRYGYPRSFGGRRGIFGFSDCPVVDGDKLICTPGGPKITVVALDKKSGQFLWRCKVPNCGGAAYSNGVVAEISGRRQFITFLQKCLVGIDVEDGELLWRKDGTVDRDYHPHTPIVRDNRIVTVRGFRDGLTMLRVTSTNQGFAVEEVYSKNRPALARYQDDTLLRGDSIYESANGVLSCFNWKTGEPRWHKRIGSRAPATFADGHVYWHESRGTMKLIQVRPEKVLIKSSFQIPDPEGRRGTSTPIVTGGRLYVREDDQLLCYDVRQEALKQDRPDPKPVTLSQPDAPVARAEPAEDRRRIPGAVFVPTPQDVVEKMIKLAEAEKDETLYDLGSGDGRILVTAAKKYGCRAVGYEVDEKLVKLSRNKAKQNGVAEQVTVHEKDLFTADLTNADIVTLYLIPAQNRKLVPKLKKLKPGSRIVSHYMPLPGIEPKKVVEMRSQHDGEDHKLYLYVTPLTEEGPKGDCP